MHVPRAVTSALSTGGLPRYSGAKVLIAILDLALHALLGFPVVSMGPR